MRSLIVMVGALSVVLAGRFHRSGTLRIGEQVSPPIGLDSVGTAKWIAQQRAACPGTLHFFYDQMPVVSLDGGAVPYQSYIVAVACARP